MKNILQLIYGLAMIFNFIAVCGLAEGDKFGWAFALASVEVVLALFCNKVFPANGKEDLV